MMMTMAPKKMKTPYSIVHSMDRKDWPMTKVNNLRGDQGMYISPCPLCQIPSNPFSM